MLPQGLNFSRKESPHLYSFPLLALLSPLGLFGHCHISIWREASNFLKLLRIQSPLGRISVGPFSIFWFLPLRLMCGRNRVGGGGQVFCVINGIPQIPG